MGVGFRDADGSDGSEVFKSELETWSVLVKACVCVLWVPQLFETSNTKGNSRNEKPGM